MSSCVDTGRVDCPIPGSVSPRADCPISGSVSPFIKLGQRSFLGLHQSFQQDSKVFGFEVIALQLAQSLGPGQSQCQWRTFSHLGRRLQPIQSLCLFANALALTPVLRIHQVVLQHVTQCLLFTDHATHNILQSFIVGARHLQHIHAVVQSRVKKFTHLVADQSLGACVDLPANRLVRTSVEAVAEAVLRELIPDFLPLVSTVDDVF